MIDDDEAAFQLAVSKLPDAPIDHNSCGTWLKECFALLDCDVTVSTAPPLVATDYDQDAGPAICPHGTLFYHEPTSEQIMRWAQEGTP